MAGLRAARGGGILRTVERLGVSRGVFGASKGWFYVGTGLWTLRKVRSLGERKTEVLMREPLRPGDRIVIANGIATIESEREEPATPATGKATSRRRRRKQKKAARRALVTQGDLSRRARRRAARSSD